MRYYAGLDIGGTTGRLLLKEEGGPVWGPYSCGGASFFASGDQRAREKYAELILPALREHGWSPKDCAGLCAAASGVDSEPLRQRCRRIFTDLGFEAERVPVYNACELFLTACRPPAMILIAGTGSITFGMGAGGKTVRTGGWGHILSDEGSGFHIGLDVIQTVGNHLDGRLNDPVLWELFEAETGIRDLETLNQFLMDHMMTKSAIARLAPLAVRAWEKGSPWGERILRDSAERLVCLVRDNGRKMEVKEEDPLTVFLWGGVLVGNPKMRELTEQGIRRIYPQAEIRIPDREAVEIALDLAETSGAGK